MAVGDAVTAVTSVASGAYLTIQPGSGVEWVIHNLSVPLGTSAELYKYDGSNEILIDSNLSGGWSGEFFHLTNSIYYRVKNTSVSTAYLGYDGIISKE